MEVLVNPRGDELWAHGGVMAGMVCPYFMAGYRGTLSLKMMVRGAGVWRTSSGLHRVDPDHALILNHGQEYTLTVDREDGPVATFCPFFSEQLVREAAATRRLPTAALLDDPGACAEIPAFVERLQRPGARLTRLAGGLGRALRAGASDLAVGWMHELVDAVLDLATEERASIDSIAAVRAATRAELFRRVHRARDFVHADLSRTHTLTELARVAAMSPHHFHRVFRALVGAAPGQYVTELRLLRARRLLCETRLSVTEICLRVGFSSLGTFSARFKRRFGASPRGARDDSQA